MNFSDYKQSEVSKAFAKMRNSQTCEKFRSVSYNGENFCFGGREQITATFENLGKHVFYNGGNIDWCENKECVKAYKAAEKVWNMNSDGVLTNGYSMLRNGVWGSLKPSKYSQLTIGGLYLEKTKSGYSSNRGKNLNHIEANELLVQAEEEYNKHRKIPMLFEFLNDVPVPLRDVLHPFSQDPVVNGFTFAGEIRLRSYTSYYERNKKCYKKEPSFEEVEIPTLECFNSMLYWCKGRAREAGYDLSDYLKNYKIANLKKDSEEVYDILKGFRGFYHNIKQCSVMKSVQFSPNKAISYTNNPELSNQITGAFIKQSGITEQDFNKLFNIIPLPRYENIEIGKFVL